jgi:endonuclease/exonuclease/phosphatase family metal-dependent hydrolase
MRIATFNVDGLGGERPGSAEEAARLPLLRDALERLRADVLCLQEVNAGHAEADGVRTRAVAALDRALAGTTYESFSRHVSAHRDGHGPLDKHNLVTLSRYPILEARQVWHDLVTPPSYRPVTAVPAREGDLTLGWDRPILLTTLDHPSGTVHVFNMHLRAPLAAHIPGQKAAAFEWKTAAGWAEGFFLAAVKRSGQALEARLAADALFDADENAMVLACGDLNADLLEMPGRILSAEVDDTGNPELEGRVLVPIERIAPEDHRYSVIHAGHRHMLDHILVSRSLASRCRAVEIHNEDLPDEILELEAGTAVAASNHAPLVAEFGP